MSQEEFFIEVIIHKEENRYKATTPSFPKCKGYGETDKEALDKLSTSIGNFIGKQSKNSIKKLMLSDNYTEVIIDPNKKDDLQHRVFSADILNTSYQQNVMIRFKPIQFAKRMADAYKKDDSFNEILDDFMNDEQLSSSIEQGVLLEEKSKHTKERLQDDYLFGISICLN